MLPGVLQLMFIAMCGCGWDPHCEWVSAIFLQLVKSKNVNLDRGNMFALAWMGGLLKMLHYNDDCNDSIGWVFQDIPRYIVYNTIHAHMQ